MLRYLIMKMSSLLLMHVDVSISQQKGKNHDQFSLKKNIIYNVTEICFYDFFFFSMRSFHIRLKHYMGHIILRSPILSPTMFK